MPTLSASDYTAYLKMKAAAGAYSSGRVPISNQTVAQPVPTQSILNARLLASQASLNVSPANTTLSSTLGRVRPLPPNNVNRKTNFATVSTSGQVQNRYVPGSLPRT
jgi:hypothetical protein